MISARNFLRSMGGGIGLAIANTIFSNILQRNLPNTTPDDILEAIKQSIFRPPDLSSLSELQRDGVLDAYMSAARGVFILWACCIGVCFLLMFFVKDNGLKRQDEKKVEDENSDGVLTVPEKSQNQSTADPAMETKNGVDVELGLKSASVPTPRENSGEQ